ncbi:unnamed protein product [Gongylonema pulchrum]|uniref:LisH domain-containing protein n=1 Tax=Gongylonema pulchrum TaxID=637853 RepID=A0A183EVI6_9BILA|nr:unnamed protein product [Gongylonema pulchrum]
MEEKPAKSLENARNELIDSLRENNAENAKRLLQKYDILRSKKDDFCISQHEEDAVAQDDVSFFFCDIPAYAIAWNR